MIQFLSAKYAKGREVDNSLGCSRDLYLGKIVGPIGNRSAHCRAPCLVLILSCDRQSTGWEAYPT